MIYNFSLFIILFLKYAITLQTSLFIVTSGDSPNLTMAGPRLVYSLTLLPLHYLKFKIPQKACNILLHKLTQLTKRGLFAVSVMFLNTK